MKKLLVFITLCFFLSSCRERIVQLPKTTNNEITEVLDVSPIYIFYNEETGESEFNRANMIGTTNWLVNIDKRLTLKLVLPHLQYLQEKRNKDSMHKNEEARNYFTCSNPETGSLAFIDFTEVQFKKDTLKKVSKKYSSLSEEKLTFLNVESLNHFSIYTSSGENHIEKNISFVVTYLEDADLDFPVFLNFSEEISFQDYISVKSELSNIKNQKLKISNQEFIYN